MTRQSPQTSHFVDASKNACLLSKVVPRFCREHGRAPRWLARLRFGLIDSCSRSSPRAPLRRSQPRLVRNLCQAARCKVVPVADQIMADRAAGQEMAGAGEISPAIGTMAGTIGTAGIDAGDGMDSFHNSNSRPTTSRVPIRITSTTTACAGAAATLLITATSMARRTPSTPRSTTATSVPITSSGRTTRTMPTPDQMAPTLTRTQDKTPGRQQQQPSRSWSTRATATTAAAGCAGTGSLTQEARSPQRVRQPLNPSDQPTSADPSIMVRTRCSTRVPATQLRSTSCPTIRRRNPTRRITRSRPARNQPARNLRATTAAAPALTPAR